EWHPPVHACVEVVMANHLLQRSESGDGGRHEVVLLVGVVGSSETRTTSISPVNWNGRWYSGDTGVPRSRPHCMVSTVRRKGRIWSTSPWAGANPSTSSFASALDPVTSNSTRTVSIGSAGGILE